MKFILSASLITGTPRNVWAASLLPWNYWVLKRILSASLITRTPCNVHSVKKCLDTSNFKSFFSWDISHKANQKPYHKMILKKAVDVFIFIPNLQGLVITEFWSFELRQVRFGTLQMKPFNCMQQVTATVWVKIPGQNKETPGEKKMLKILLIISELKSIVLSSPKSWKLS